MATQKPIDYKGEEINVGDFVIYAIHANFRLGVVKSIMSPTRFISNYIKMDASYVRQNNTWVRVVKGCAIKSQSVETQWRHVWKPSLQELQGVIGQEEYAQEYLDLQQKNLAKNAD